MPDDRSHLLLPGDDYERDWWGAAGFEDDIGVAGKFIEEIVGLDHDEWSVLAISLLPGTTRSADDDVYVYAVRKDDIPRVDGLHPNDELKLFAEKNGGVPVTRFHCPEVTVNDIFRGMFKSGVIQLRPNGIPKWIQLLVANEGGTTIAR